MIPMLVSKVTVFGKIFYWIFLMLDGIVYNFVNLCYQIFVVVAGAKIFTSETFTTFANRIYTILGVAMLFVIAFQLLNAVINPDMLNKNDKSTTKLAGNIVISLIYLAFVGTAFKYLYIFQDKIIKSGLIQKVILGEAGNINENATVLHAGNDMAADVLFAFLHPRSVSTTSECGDYRSTSGTDPGSAGGYDYSSITRSNVNLAECISANSDKNYANYCCTYMASKTDGNYFRLAGAQADLIPLLNDDENEYTIDYTFIISTLSGAFVCYILISFCIDIGVRCAKMGFYQLIAPIPILMRIIPSKKAQFDKYIKDVASTYIDLFVRLLIIFFAVYVCTLIPETIANLFKTGFGGADSAGLGIGWLVGSIATVIIILGVLSFAKAAPKLISDLLGVSGGNIALGIGKKLNDNKLAMGGAGAIGSSVSSLARNTAHGIQNRDRSKSWINNATKIAGSGLAGAASGLYRGGKAGYHTDNIKNLGSTIASTRDIVEQKRDQREAYHAAHEDEGVLKSRIRDKGDAVKEWATGGGDSTLKRQSKALRQVATDRDAIKTLLDSKDGVKDVQRQMDNALAGFEAAYATKYKMPEMPTMTEPVEPVGGPPKAPSMPMPQPPPPPRISSVLMPGETMESKRIANEKANSEYVEQNRKYLEDKSKYDLEQSNYSQAMQKYNATKSEYQEKKRAYDKEQENYKAALEAYNKAQDPSMKKAEFTELRKKWDAELNKARNEEMINQLNAGENGNRELINIMTRMAKNIAENNSQLVGENGKKITISDSDGHTLDSMDVSRKLTEAAKKGGTIDYNAIIKALGNEANTQAKISDQKIREKEEKKK